MRFIHSDTYKGPVPFDPLWVPNGDERYAISFLTRSDDRKAADDAQVFWQSGCAPVISANTGE